LPKLKNNNNNLESRLFIIIPYVRISSTLGTMMWS